MTGWIAPSQFDEAVVARVMELTAEKMTVKAIAAAVGRSERAVYRMRKHAGYKAAPRKNEWTPETKAAVRELVREGLPHREIARTLHVSHRAIARHFPGTAWSPQVAGAHRVKTVRRDNKNVAVL